MSTPNPYLRTEDPRRIAWRFHHPRPVQPTDGTYETEVFLKLEETDPVIASSKTLRDHMAELVADVLREDDGRLDGPIEVTVTHPSARSFERLAEGQLLVRAIADTADATPAAPGV